MGFFESSDATADAKAEIVEHAVPRQVLVANADDPRVMSRVGPFGGRTVTFGIQNAADVRATNVEMLGLDGVRAHVQTPSGAFALSTPLLGFGNLANALAATAVAVTFDVPLDAIAARASAFRAAHHRGELVRLPGGLTLIDDSYNSSPAALRRALEVVSTATGSARKIAVLGEMLELGAHADALHRESGRAAQAAGLHCLVVVGGAPGKQLAEGAAEAGMPARNIVFVSDRTQAIDAVLSGVRPGDLVLIKGSRGIGLDAVVERLKAEFA